MSGSAVIERQISDHDDVLRLMRGKWLNADEGDKPGWMAKIDGILDERCRIMRKRRPDSGLTEGRAAL